MNIYLKWTSLDLSPTDPLSLFDLEISQENLDKYPEDKPPVVVDYRQSFSNKDVESTAVYDNEEEEGTETGNRPVRQAPGVLFQ